MTAPSLELLCEGFLGPSKEKASHQKQVHISPGSLHPSQRLCHNAFFALFIRRRLPGYGIIEANTCVKLNILLYVSAYLPGWAQALHLRPASFIMSIMALHVVQCQRSTLDRRCMAQLCNACDV